MNMEFVKVSHEFEQPVERVFAYLSEHEHLGALFHAPVKRIRSGNSERNGVGSCRRIGPPGPLGLEETVLEYVADERIVYEITSGSPLRRHQGVMEFSGSDNGGSRLEYRIRFGSPIPGLARLVRHRLERSIPAGLRVVEARA
jgi:uncharacterized protein YndB with AHSA1/START domain